MAELSPKQKMRRQVNAIRMIHRMEKAARRVPVLLLVAVWYGASCFAITTSKMAMQIFAAPFCLCLCQFLVAVLVSRVTMSLNGDTPSPRGQESSVLWKIAASYTMGFMLTNVAFSLSS